MTSVKKYKLIITNTSHSHAGNSIYLSGDLNGWKLPGIKIGEVPAGEEKKEMILDNINADHFSFKLHRGSWDTLICNPDGSPIAPFFFSKNKEPQLEINIESWRDHFPSSTASKQVRLFDSAFSFKRLGANRRIWIYLPEDYHHSTRKYPVLYMHDGQSLFDEATATGRQGPVEWEVDKSINLSKHDAIVVAIAHGEQPKDRETDYAVSPFDSTEKRKGKAYLEDIVRDLKPRIDRAFKTRSDRDNTAIAGSSLGGLISLYAGLIYPDSFGTIGALSPSLWFDAGRIASFLSVLKQKEKMAGQGYYFYAGHLEKRQRRKEPDVDLVKDVKSFSQLLAATVHPSIKLSFNPEGKHGALYWQKEFPVFFEWWQTRISNQ